MTVLSRGARARRGGRRPGWLLLTVLLVLAIAASSALVFTNRVELLKLAVILALWAAVVGAFVSVIYRRQSDADQAKVRDLKLVYDLQLDREISARREYELTVETHLRRELSSELRAQASDEVAALRAELAALRTNLEILFDADLAHRPAIETDRVYQPKPDRVASSRITAVREEHEELNPRTAESPIIDVPEEPLATSMRRPADDPVYRGSHRLPNEETTWIPPVRPGPPPAPATPPSEPVPSGSAPSSPVPRPARPPQPAPQPSPPQQQRPSQQQRPPVQEPAAAERPVSKPTPAAAPPPPASTPIPMPPVTESAPPTPTPPTPTPPTPTVPTPQPTPEAEPERRGRHYGAAAADTTPGPRGRHSVPGEPATGQRSTPAPAEPEVPEEPAPQTPSEPAPRHRGADAEDSGPPTGGISAAELLARLQAGATSEGGRRRRRED